jgi:hypothetical protein
MMTPLDDWPVFATPVVAKTESPLTIAPNTVNRKRGPTAVSMRARAQALAGQMRHIVVCGGSER